MLRAFDWYQNRWPWMTLNGVVAVILANLSSFRAHCIKVHVRYLISWWVLVTGRLPFLPPNPTASKHWRPTKQWTMLHFAITWQQNLQHATSITQMHTAHEYHCSCIIINQAITKIWNHLQQDDQQHVILDKHTRNNKEPRTSCANEAISTQSTITITTSTFDPTIR